MGALLYKDSISRKMGQLRISKVREVREESTNFQNDNYFRHNQCRSFYIS